MTIIRLLKIIDRMKELILLRGLPGSGKSTFAEVIGGFRCEADMYFMEDGEYKFDITRIEKAQGNRIKHIYTSVGNGSLL